MAWLAITAGVLAATLTHRREIPSDVLGEMVRTGTLVACSTGAYFGLLALLDARRARRVDASEGADRRDPVQVRRFVLRLSIEEARRVCTDALAATVEPTTFRPVKASADTIVARSTSLWRGHLPVLRVELLSLDAASTHVRLSGSSSDAPLAFDGARTLRAVEAARRAILDGADRTRARERMAVPGWSAPDGEAIAR